jgi:predicted phage baseplate assembly protein
VSSALDDSVRGLADCGCCSGLGPSTPGVVFNRPGLSAIAYRSATWHEFKASLTAALSSGAHPELAGLTTRAGDDFSIAFLDAFAVVGDVLTFYQERIANESYLRTATERRSLLELARLIGYELKPGAAAETLLAFTVEESRESPRVATVDVGVKVQSVPGRDEKAQTFETVEKIEARAEWNAMRPKLTAPQTLGTGTTALWLDGTATDLKAGDIVLLVGPEREGSVSDEHWDARRVMSVKPDFDAKRTRVVLGPGLGSTHPSSAPSSAPKVYAMRTRAGVFGQNAAEWKAMSADFKFNYLGRVPANDAEKADWPGFTVYSPGGPPAGNRAALDLDQVYPAVLPDSWLLLATPDYVELYKVTGAVSASRAQFGLAGKTTRVTIEGENFSQFTNLVRTTAVHAQSVELPRAEAPIDRPVTGHAQALTLDADVGALPEGRRLIVLGHDAATGMDVSESVVLSRVEAAGSVSRLVFTTALVHSYRLDTLKIHGNVAAATHGESVAEALGSGDAGRRYQRFELRQPPLTFVRDPDAASGTVSTLELRVNDLRWDEVPTFYGRGPNERVYVTRRDDEGRTTVSFGDGVHGSRLPSGPENLRARYRKGVGVAGNVRAGQLTTLLTRPLGLKGAINPRPAEGGDDAEPSASARGNAPLTVLTLDRVVSLSDYEDFARAYAGIKKALATWSWDGERRGVFVTVAGPGGAPVADGVVELLLGAIRKAGDPYVPLRVASYRPARFTTGFKLKVDPARPKDKVIVAVLNALRAGFGFEARAFGREVALSDVIATIQNVAGVIAVDVDALVRTDGVGGSGLVAPLPCAVPQATSLSGSQAAELLTLDDGPIEPGEMS